LNSFDSYVQFMNRLKDLVAFILPLCKREGRSYLNIAIAAQEADTGLLQWQRK